jgi:crotonobetainyl-CoA:carnitine CoA-transferase CaiB-like acyl-CoA transferase
MGGLVARVDTGDKVVADGLQSCRGPRRNAAVAPRSSRATSRAPSPAVGPIKALVPPATLDGDEPVMGPIPAPGQHTEQILAELGLSSTGTRVGG